MKDAKQFFLDFTDNEMLRNQIFEEMNRLRGSETLEIWQAGQKAALALGYEVPDEVARTIIVRLQGLDAEGLGKLSEDEAKAIASGDPRLPACC